MKSKQEVEDLFEKMDRFRIKHTSMTYDDPNFESYQRGKFDALQWVLGHLDEEESAEFAAEFV